jgi:hypothetical protein
VRRAEQVPAILRVAGTSVICVYLPEVSVARAWIRGVRILQLLPVLTVLLLVAREERAVLLVLELLAREEVQR